MTFPSEIWIDDFQCPDCEHEFAVRVTPPVPARNPRGRMDDCDPPEAGYSVPEECQQCGRNIVDEAVAQAEDQEPICYD